MYYLFTCHHITPSDYYQKGHGEKLILRAFFLADMEAKKEETMRLKMKGGGLNG